MKNLIERYIYDVTRRLPESERAEVSRELEASIMDMLPDNPGEQQIIEVLTKLGDPRLMAEQYRAKPRYLISPAIFDDYIGTLKIVVGIVAAVFVGISAMVTIFDTSIPFSVGTLFGNIFEDAIMGALQAAFWVTLVFAIIDHTKVGKKETWKVADLPEKPDTKATKISRASVIGEAFMTIFFTVIIILMIVRNEWLFVFIRGTNIINPFTEEALLRAIPYLIISGLAGLIVCAFKLYYARWTVPLFLIKIFHNVIWVSITIFILYWPDLFNPELGPMLKELFNITTFNIDNFKIIFAAVMLFAGVLDTITAAVNTWRDNRGKE
jgi:hypothetical protein